MGNNLSYPAVFTGAAMALRGLEGGWTFGGTFSYGCDVPDGEYANTSCVDEAGSPLSLEACAAGPCAGATIERLYWQQDAVNTWQAGSLDLAGAQTARYLDWGDNLESVSWSEGSIIRVETTPFADLGAVTQRGFQAWHVFGQGPDEMWGARATEPADALAAALPYVYDSPYAIVHTANAKLRLTKLAAGTATCPTAAGGTAGFTGDWDAVNHLWTGAAFNAAVIAYTPELNIGGKVVFGYNWNVKKMVVPADVVKSGWWRLTFYTTDGSVVFDAANPVVALAPPVLPVTPAPVALDVGVAAEEGDTGPLYAPVVDYEHGVTYIDVCLTARKGGGGGRRP